ncbi:MULTISPECIES: hypothetical protein [unclassified Amycolatopsis]|uniref:hypothetical protein n=1 Tax=unclassified Amycolatopsis TaxID=2618356 RepID=UPI00106EE29B|nr:MULTISPECIES: hypothetical protein [unclassified Amycolatopsis]
MKMPSDLGKHGRETWSAVTGFWHADGILPDPHELLLLAEAARCADRLELLRGLIAEADAGNVGKLLSEERQTRALLAVILTTRLGLPTGLPVEDAPHKQMTAASRRASVAARARWRREKGAM